MKRSLENRWISNAWHPNIPVTKLLIASIIGGLVLGFGTKTARADRKPEFSTPDPVVINAGFLFADGHYIDAPYEISVDDDQVRVNSAVLDFAEYRTNDDATQNAFLPDAPKASEFQRQRAERRRRMGDRAGRPRLTPAAAFASNLSFFLRSQNVIVLEAGETPVILDYSRGGEELVSLLNHTKGRTFANSHELLEELRTQNVDLDFFHMWIGDFRPTASFTLRAGVEGEAVTAIFQANESSSRKFRWRERLAYPLTVIGMVLVVLAFGHLLNNRPIPLPSLPSTNSAASGSSVGGTTFDSFGIEQDRVVRRSLMLVFALSAMDLIWTIFASQDGQMNELNPLGSQLIHNPLALFAVKLGVTGLSVGLLFALRRQPLAQQASWWSCLLLTLLTARWLTFQSMFVA